MRIDVFLANSGILQSRTEAKKFIENGWVFVDSKPVDKLASRVHCGIKFQLPTGLICLTDKNPLLAALFSLPSLISPLPYWFFLVLLPK